MIKKMKTKLCILFGGKSVEHDVSVLSTKNLLPNFRRDQYEIYLVGIDKQGFWHLSDETCQLNDPRPFYEVIGEIVRWGVDVVFPILHGLNGEDGTIQGLLEVMNVAYVGPNVLAAAVGLDKDVMKRLAREAGVPMTDFIACVDYPDYEKVKDRLSLPIYIKPASMGSTLGITTAYSEAEFAKGFSIAKKFDHKVILEKKVRGREFECSVIGLDNPIASLPCEIVAKTGVYSYTGKYFDRSLTNYIYPAQIEIELVKKFQEIALQIYKLLCSEVMARVDFFYTEEGEILFNEINTIPGFTYMSMFHRMWEVSDLPTPDLVDRLIEYAFERHHRKFSKEHTFQEEELLV